MTDAWILRTAIIVAGALLLAAIYFFGRPRKPGQGRRVEGAGRGGFADGGRVEPTLGEMSEHVQFLFVTHNKATMEAAQQLSGVTMREPGVSRLVSVDLAEAARLAGAA